MAVDLRHARARRYRSGYGGLLSSLSQATGVHFNELGQTGDDEIPFIRQTVSPAAVGELGLETCGHDVDHFGGIGVGIQIQVTAKVGPMIERLDYRDRASTFFQSGADLRQKTERVIN